MAYHPFRNPGLKALSVLIAVLLWLTVAGEQIVVRSLRVPLEFQNQPDHLEITDVSPGTVDVRVRGSAGVLAHLVLGDVVAVVDLSSAKPGRRIFHLSPDQVRVPSGVEVLQVNPPELPLDFEQSESRVIPIMPNVDGKPADGYVVDRIEVEPATVTVQGPRSAVMQLKEAMTEPVSVAGAERPVKETVTIGLQTPGVRLVSARTAVVAVNVMPAPAERSIDNVPVRMRNTPAGLTAQVTPAVVTLAARGPKNTIGSIAPDAIVAFVELAGLGRGQYNLRVRVEPAQALEILRIDPVVVRVTLR
jgi:YbbR domain-containing protein